MEKNKQVNPYMVVLARKSRGFTQGALATKLAISQAKLSLVENGEYEVDEKLLAKLAQSLEYPESFFFQAGNITPPGLSVYHRKRKSLPKRKLDQIEASLNIIQRHVNALLESAELGDSQIPFMDIDDFGSAQTIAAALRRFWKVPSGPIRNLTELLENTGIVVIHHNFEARQIDAETMMSRNGPPVIFVNSSTPGDRIRFSLAHELGHIIMHGLPNPNMEAEANQFAGAFLIPGDELVGTLKIPVTIESLAQQKPYWKTSMGCILEQAYANNLVDSGRRVYLRKMFSVLGYNKIEPPELDVQVEAPSLVDELLAVHTNELSYTPERLATSKLHLLPDEYGKYYGKTEGGLRLVYSS